MIRKTIRARGLGRMAWLVVCGYGLSAHAQAAWATEGETTPGQPSEAETTEAAETTKTHDQQIDERLKVLEEKSAALTDRLENEAVERMIQDAQNEARAAGEERKPEEREFLAGGLALQKLNPEITFCGDMLAGLIVDGRKFYAGESDRSGIPVRAVGLHFQHVLDPYSMFKSAFHISPEHGFHTEEIYISWFGIVPSMSFTVGRFRQNFGILNRWHEHDLDQTEYPLALTQVLGEEGLIGDGLVVKWLMPSLWAHVNELTLEVVNGTNDVLFSGEHFTVPSTLLHLKNYYDLTPSTYLELGLTGMFGFNNKRGIPADDGALVDEPWRKTYVGGADLTLYWSPLDQARYRSFLWRSEFYYANKQLPDGEPRTSQVSWGAYSYLQYQLSVRWFLGVRGDLFVPTVRANDEVAWDVVPYLTVWQSEFVYLRFEYRHGERIPYQAPDGGLGRRTDNRVLLQIDFAAGPHKHEKY
jgi:hypothetical protein